MFWNNRARRNNVYDDDENPNGEFEYQDEFDEQQEEEEEFAEDQQQYVERNFNEAPPQSAPTRRQTYASAPRSNPSSDGRVLNIHATAQLQVIIRKPETIEDAEEIADSLLERNTVIVNLENTNKEVGRRILDFLSGVSYANHGALTRVAHATYMVTPYNVGIVGQDVIGELENSGVFFG